MVIWDTYGIIMVLVLLYLNQPDDTVKNIHNEKEKSMNEKLKIFSGKIKE